jgi:zinc protease
LFDKPAHTDDKGSSEAHQTVTTRRTRLQNGLTLLSEEIHDAPVVALQAWVHVGSADETDEIAGIAHVHEHMLFKGTTRRGVGEIARTVEASGGEINAWTSFDQTVYHLVLATEELETGLDILADALQNSSFDAEELEREVEVVVEEIRRADDSPSRRMAKALFALAYEKHPYRRPVIGTETAIRNLTRERILSFFHENYRPDQVTLVVVGDFDGEDLDALVERAFGGWSRDGARLRPARVGEPEQSEIRARVLIEDVKEARLALAWHIQGLRHEDAAAIDALSVILGHGESSRLYVETRRQRELVNDVYAYAYTPHDPGLLMVGAGLRRGDVEDALASIADESLALRHRLVSEEELEKAKVVILSEAAYQRETVQGEARKLGYFEVVAGDHAFEQEYDKALARLAPEDLRRAAQRYLTAAPSVVAQVPQEDEPLQAARLATIIQERYAAAEEPPVRVRRTGPRGVTRIELDNGAVILVKPEDRPVVAMRAVALGGLRWEEEATQGLGHLFASLWGRATETLSMEVLSQRVALFGGSLSAFSGRNTVGMRGEFIREKALDGLGLFTDALLRTVFHLTDVERERAVILERIRNRDDNPSVVAFDLFTRTLYPTHPYGLRIVGDESSVESFRADELVEYERLYAAPDKLVVAVVGGIDGERAADLVASHLSHERTPPLRDPPPMDPVPESLRRSGRELAKQQSHVVIGGRGTTVGDPDRYVLEVLTTVLSGQSGRLFLDLRDKQSLAYALSSSSVDGLDPGYVLVHVGTSPDKVEQALSAVYGHLKRLREEAVQAEELERAKRYLIGTHAIDLQRCGARAMVMALGERFGLGYDQYTRYEAAIRAINADDVIRAASTYLAEERLVETVVGPAFGSVASTAADA